MCLASILQSVSEQTDRLSLVQRFDDVRLFALMLPDQIAVLPESPALGSFVATRYRPIDRTEPTSTRGEEHHRPIARLQLLNEVRVVGCENVLGIPDQRRYRPCRLS